MTEEARKKLLSERLKNLRPFELPETPYSNPIDASWLKVDFIAYEKGVVTHYYKGNKTYQHKGKKK